MAQSEERPANKKLYLAVMAAAVVFVLIFTLLLRINWRTPFRLDPADYQVDYPAGFVYTASAQTQDGAYFLDGWACIRQEKMEWVDCWVVFYDAAADTYYRIPTLAGILGDAATEAIDDGFVYGRAGFSALVPLQKLPGAPQSYELCFAYRSNGHNYLIHTGQAALGEEV